MICGNLVSSWIYQNIIRILMKSTYFLRQKTWSYLESESFLFYPTGPRFVRRWAPWRRACPSWRGHPATPSGKRGRKRRATWSGSSRGWDWCPNVSHHPTVLGIFHLQHFFLGRWCETNPQKGDIYQPLFNICQKHQISNCQQALKKMCSSVDHYSGAGPKISHLGKPQRMSSNTSHWCFIYSVGSKTLFGHTVLDSKPGLLGLQIDCFPCHSSHHLRCSVSHEVAIYIYTYS